MTILTDAILDARAAKGAALLDPRHPHWRDEISILTLDLSNVDCCVLGQLYTPSDRDVSAFERGWRDLGLNLLTAVQSGFILSGSEIEARYHEGARSGDEIYSPLTGAWTRLILGRREEA